MSAYLVPGNVTFLLHVSPHLILLTYGNSSVVSYVYFTNEESNRVVKHLDQRGAMT